MATVLQQLEKLLLILEICYRKDLSSNSGTRYKISFFTFICCKNFTVWKDKNWIKQRSSNGPHIWLKSDPRASKILSQASIQKQFSPSLAMIARCRNGGCLVVVGEIHLVQLCLMCNVWHSKNMRKAVTSFLLCGCVCVCAYGLLQECRTVGQWLWVSW